MFWVCLEKPVEIETLLVEEKDSIKETEVVVNDQSITAENLLIDITKDSQPDDGTEENQNDTEITDRDYICLMSDPSKVTNEELFLISSVNSIL